MKALILLDIFRNLIHLLNLRFLAVFLQKLFAMCQHMAKSFCKKTTQESSNFSNKAGYARCLLFIFPFCTFQGKDLGNSLIVNTRELVFADFPQAFNPCLIEVEEGFLMAFRYCPDRDEKPWISQIGLVLLDRQFDPILPPQLLMTRRDLSKTPSQSEDPRLFTYRGRIFVSFNDSTEVVNPNYGQRRDIYVAEIFRSGTGFSLSSPLKLISVEKYETQLWQKNWVPFEWKDRLFFIYSIDPHMIISPNLFDGKSYVFYETKSNSIEWAYGCLRGGTPPLLLQGEYLSFFHSSVQMRSEVSCGRNLWHYFLGAYTFSSEPPFQITKMSPTPIIDDAFYTESECEKRVVFPGGYVVVDRYIYLAYGKDDREIWIATIDKDQLLSCLQPVD